MNISRLHSVHTHSTARAAAKPTLPEQTGSIADDALAAPSQVDDSGDVQAADQGSLAKRLASLTSKLETRVQNAVDSNKLTDEQKQQVQAAAEKFQQLMGRIGNADFANSPKRQVLYAIHQMTNQVHQILQPADDGTSAVSGSGDTTGTGATQFTRQNAKIDELA